MKTTWNVLFMVTLSVSSVPAFGNQMEKESNTQKLLVSKDIDPSKHCVHEGVLYSQGSEVKMVKKTKTCLDANSWDLTIGRPVFLVWDVEKK